MEINLYDTQTTTYGSTDKFVADSYTHIPPAIPMNLHDVLCSPEYRTKGSAGADLKASKECVLLPNQTLVVSTGISLAIPEGFVGLLFPRSGLASRGITLANSVGVIDSDYRGEIMVPMVNRSTDPVVLNHGDRIAQIVFIPVTQFPFVVAENLGDTSRGSGGFGSTGV
jgi:dUTP pyrophosphatase